MGWRVIAAIFALITTPTTLAAQNADPWTGLYQAIDHVDGSIDHLSIFANGDGSYTLVGTASNHGACTEKAGMPKRGWHKASGTLRDGKLTRENVIVTCEGLEDTIRVADSVLTRDATSGTLSVPVKNGTKTLVFHRID
ncbi:MAG: hypothetical protein MPJ78_04490 [Hyphomicrobiaceae bacterium]|nr:hypothetical protein [Hyphomicrobiaceae bacterium]